MQCRGHPISKRLTPDEQVRFHNLLKLAKESPFPGERDNALAAAERLASRHGLTLEEAATGATQSQTAQPNADTSKFARDLAAFVHMTDYQIYLEKQRRDAARQEAEERGLDRKNKRPPPPPPRQARRSNAKMEPHRHAWTLVRETKMSYQEISSITGLDIYQVLLMKIQLLRAA
ncbi:MAG: DUF2786 domain-containing protein [Alphaproteobacteria bacterium]|nr:DUF2786 domain-containing protein [Alphaproteobacteria bacterium]